MLMGLVRQIRAYYLTIAARVAVDNFSNYRLKVEQRIYYRFKVYEKAMNDYTAAPDATTNAALLDARADLYDDMREYLLVDLTHPEIEQGLPVRPADYSVEELKVTTHYVGHDIPVSHYTRKLVKNTSSEIPELNYPTPFWQGYTKGQIEDEVAKFIERTKDVISTETGNP